MIQIDGLSRRQMLTAMRKGHLPFLKRLVHKRSYENYSLYSGLPSNTPGMQGELFYGVKCAVPAFSFKHQTSGQIFRMYEPFSAQVIERELAAQGEGLLKDGSSYSNIFAGGAENAHFCAASIGWKGLLKVLNPWSISLWALFYVDIFVRMIVLAAVELVIAFWDFLKGFIRYGSFRKEFEFIFARIIACVLLREMVVMGVQMDIHRGLPIIHANFIGYDEQAHRRGPASGFAHWSLGGIDDSVRRIYETAKHSKNRKYQIWVYSDHGQEATATYKHPETDTLEDAVKSIYERSCLRGKGEMRAAKMAGTGVLRARLIDERLFREAQDSHDSTLVNEPCVTAMGPVGHVYLQGSLDSKELTVMASELVRAGVPLVLSGKGSADGVKAWVKEKELSLPEDASGIFGPDHPFLEEATDDLIRLCRHENAGDLIVMGWTHGQSALSFPVEKGAHAGIGAEETHGFAMIPSRVQILPAGKKYVRAGDLRRAAQEFMTIKSLNVTCC